MSIRPSGRVRPFDCSMCKEGESEIAPHTQWKEMAKLLTTGLPFEGGGRSEKCFRLKGIDPSDHCEVIYWTEDWGISIGPLGMLNDWEKIVVRNTSDLGNWPLRGYRTEGGIKRIIIIAICYARYPKYSSPRVSVQFFLPCLDFLDIFMAILRTIPF